MRHDGDDATARRRWEPEAQRQPDAEILRLLSRLTYLSAVGPALSKKVMTCNDTGARY
jgi:hypothetical protein